MPAMFWGINSGQNCTKNAENYAKHSLELTSNHFATKSIWLDGGKFYQCEQLMLSSFKVTAVDTCLRDAGLSDGDPVASDIVVRNRPKPRAQVVQKKPGKKTKPIDPSWKLRIHPRGIRAEKNSRTDTVATCKYLVEVCHCILWRFVFSCHLINTMLT